jgi:hypothetical protein
VRCFYRMALIPACICLKLFFCVLQHMLLAFRGKLGLDPDSIPSDGKLLRRNSHLAQPCNHRPELNKGSYAFQYPHMRPTNFLQRGVSKLLWGSDHDCLTLINSSFVNSGNLCSSPLVSPEVPGSTVRVTYSSIVLLTLKIVTTISTALYP